MALEAGDGFISGLVATNPVNATDQVAQGDDHIRLIKTALLGSFPGITGAVTATHVELNLLDGVTLSTANINDAALKGASNVFTGQIQTISHASGPYWRLSDPDQAANEKHWRIRNNAGKFQIVTEDDSNVATSFALDITRSGAAVTEIEMNTTTFDFNGQLDVDAAVHDINGSTSVTLTGTANAALALTTSGISAAGVLTTPNTSASELGYKGTPQNVQNGDYGIVLTDCGKTIYKASGGAGETITIPANGTIAIPVGAIIRVVNNGGGDLTIAITTDVLSLAGVGTNGSRTLADHGVAVLEKVASQEWFISGVGVT